MRQVGSIRLVPDHPSGPHWAIRCEPHVRIRLKRIFERIPKAATDVIFVTDTPENAAELEWMIVRFPMSVTPAAYLSKRAAGFRERASTIERVLGSEYTPPSFAGMALPPRHYQQIAADLAMKTGRLLLADDLGLGKTCSAICALTDPANLPALVVTLTHLPQQWRAEIGRFLPALTTHILKKGQPYGFGSRAPANQLALPGRAGVEFPDVIISNYHKLQGWCDVLAGKVNTIIFDECQELRLPDSLKYEAAKRLARDCKLRIGLSATPIYNMAGEIHSVLDVIAPGDLGTPQEFAREWCDGSTGMGRAAAVKDPKALGYYLREQGLMLRRTRADVGRELPPLQRIPLPVECDTAALDTIEKSTAELAKIILQRSGVKPFEKLRASEEFSNALRQATGIAKAPYVAQFVRMLVEQGTPVVLFGWHREVYSIWLKALEDLGAVMFTGSESAKQKEAAKQRFIAGEVRILIMSLRSGAGLDGLQGVCSTAVFGELDWSPKVHDQCIGRVHRDGQAEPCFAYFTLADSGSDPVVADVLGLKTAQAEGVVNPDAPLVVEDTVDPSHIKRLAEDYLRQRGHATAGAA